ncbi:HNH endonuclease [Burkholderia perseverans]|uniref:HNH endonuclease n=1 Tax=Burkholderia perseverans TaxID=2615214 RepID=UPI001FEDE26B|nr:HNH endonuclease [Burkholderia perseverans]
MSIKLPDFLAWPSLNRLRDRMGAPLVERFGVQQASTEIEALLRERLKSSGVDVTLDQIEVLDDGTLAYGNHRILLYIRDVSTNHTPRYHIADCRTLQAARENQRFERYVGANPDSDSFLVNYTKSGAGPRHERLNVCKNCLERIDWDDYRGAAYGRRDAIFRQFTLADFFTRYPRDLFSRRPKHSAETAPSNVYPPDWQEISKRVRHERGYRCQKCSTVLANADSHFLHVHHRNGLKYDNAPRNLEALCIGCHSDKPKHEHLKLTDDYRAFQARYRESP